MSKKWFTLGILISVALVGKVSATKPPRPNIIFVLADDLGYMDLVSYAARVKGVDREGCYYETPNLDRLADQAVVFTQAYACPLCSPTRSSLITGKYAASQGFMTATPGGYKTYYNQGMETPDGFYDQDGLENKTDRSQWPLTQGISNIALPSGETTIAEALAGYNSAFIGKWHLGGHGSEGFSPSDQGFEALAWFDSGGSEYFNWRDRWNGKKKEHPNMAQAELQQGNAGGETGEDYLTDDLTVQACRYIERQAKSDKPFFLYFCQFAVHTPFGAKPEDIKHFAQKKTRGWNGHANPTYAAMLKSMDDSIGALIQTLEKTGQADNTVIVFMSDNGGIVHPDENGKPAVSNNAPLKGEKALLYEGGIRVPLMIWYPKSVKPALCDVPVDCNDLYPTLLEMGGEPPASGDGESLVPLLINPKNISQKYSRDTFFWHYPFYVSVGLKKGVLTGPRSAIRKGDWKLILNWEGGLELYNIRTDLSEASELSAKEPERTQAMFKELAGWLNETVETRYIPRTNSRFDPQHAEARPFKNIFEQQNMSRPIGRISRVEK
ncbi:Arylsulfatase [Pontiella desulfatans]|uniref:Arylsulfatase n=1 Tax=Pontiella desulfatans TaxID=2750659 RepID=A0A6C2TVC6_PONDE|nr:sulfatase [Pontiella desulfatans]SPS73598.1 sulfatase S1_16 [Kiritimatiellales bacterium]VGO11477.1 Arylsulfatase [Pontiella desulfatans]